MIVWVTVCGKAFYSHPNATVHAASWKGIYLWQLWSTIRNIRHSFQWQHWPYTVIVVVDVTTDELMIYLAIIIYQRIQKYIHSCIDTYIHIHKHTYKHTYDDDIFVCLCRPTMAINHVNRPTYRTTLAIDHINLDKR